MAQEAHVRAIGGKRMKGVCPNCGRHFEAVTDRAVYCSGRCRAEASRKRRQADLTAALDEAERALMKARLILSPKG